MKEQQGIQILHEDNHLIAVYKPAGWLVQGDSTGDTPISEYVKQYIKIRYDKPGDVFLGTIHRIDRPVSGVVVFARTSKALSRMNTLFRERKVTKRYWAITNDRPNPFAGTLTHWIEKDETRNIAKASNRSGSKSKKAILDYHLNASIDQHHLIAVQPHTGRAHQIRVQLAKIGTPIRGDIKYGSTKINDDGRIHLHAYALSFEHPVKKQPVTITAPFPKDPVWSKFKEWQNDFLINTL